MSETKGPETPIVENEQHFSVFGRRRGKMFMKLFYYEGLMLFLPYIILSYLSHIEFDSTIPQSVFIVIMMGLSLMALFIMDFVGFQSRILDRYSRFITLSLAILGLFGALIFYIFSWNDFDIYNWGIAIGTVFILIAFQGLGWYFIRADRAIVAKKEGPYFRSTVYALGISSFGFLFELIIPRGIIIWILGSFIAFLIIMRYELVSVTPKIKIRNIIKPFRRVTAWNFSIDMLKLGSIVITFIAFSYNADYILFPIGSNLIANQWVLNLFIVGLSGTVAMVLFNYIKDKLFGLFVIIIVFIVNFSMTVIIWLFHPVPWIIIAILNGFTLAGLYFFIEQKMDSSSNVRAMSGSFYILVFMLFTIAIVLRTEPSLARILTNLGPIVSLVGIAYVIGYLRGTPHKSLKVYWGPELTESNQ